MMGIRSNQTAAALVGTLLLALILAAPPGRPASAAPEDVQRDLVDVAGADEPHTPPALNRAIAFRYHAPQAGRPSAALLLVPGLNSGPNSLDLISRALVATYGPSLEVWAMAMRSTQLQDRRGVEEALAYGNPDFALGYYYGKLAIDGRMFHLLRGPEVPYMAYWGVDVHLRDIRALVHEIHARYPSVPVILGGHSLGGIMAGAYAGYDFAALSESGPASNRAAPEVGGREISGLLFLDGLPLRIPIHLSPGQYLHGITVPILGRIPGVDNLTAADPGRRVWPFTRTSKIARTRDSILLDVLSVYAYLRPESASIFPFPPRNGVPITNEALVAALFSDQMEPDLLVRAGVEIPVGIFNRIPDPANVNYRGLLDLESGRPVRGERLIRLPPPQDRGGVRVPIRSLVGAILRPGGDFTLWYFPWRLILDFGLAANLDTSDAFARQYLHLTHVRETAVPILAIGAGHGIIRSTRMTDFYLRHIATPPGRVTVKIFSDYSHLDVEDADPNPAVPLIVDWLKMVVH